MLRLAGDFTILKYCNTAIDSTVNVINGDYLQCQQAGATYQWYRDGILLTGETQQGINLLPYGIGNYYCEIQLYCCSKSTAIYSMNSVEIIEEVKLDCTIFPNPTSGSFMVTSNLSGEVKLVIQNVVGEITYQEDFLDRLSFSKEIQIQLSKGLYFVELRNKERSLRKRILIN